MIGTRVVLRLESRIATLSAGKLGDTVFGMAYRFPIARKVLAFAVRARRNWLERHRRPFNFWIHMIGIPLALAGIPLLFLAPWYWGFGTIVVGYFLQWLGHRVEGNDVGEFIPVKKFLGMPYVAIAPEPAPRR